MAAPAVFGGGGALPPGLGGLGARWAGREAVYRA
jgi:hypothetical protein